jgi:hypothetical protein
VIVKLKYEKRESHVVCRVMVGEEQLHMTHSGVLVMTVEEYEFFKQLLKDGVLLTKGAEFQESDSSQGSSSSYPKIQFPPGAAP